MTGNAPRTDGEASWQAIPPDPPPLPDHYLYGPVTRSQQFGQYFTVAYYGTHCEQLTWAGDRWRFQPFPAPRPIFGRELLIRRPHDPVLIVDTPDIAVFSRKHLPAYVVVSWAGGVTKLMENDWRPLRLRNVLLWPNAGMFHGKLIALLNLTAESVAIIDARDQAPGFSVPDVPRVLAPGQTLVSWASARMKQPEDFKPDEVTVERPLEVLDARGWEAIREAGWDDLGLMCNRVGAPYATVANASRFLENHPACPWHDEFTNRVMFMHDGKQCVWSSRESARLLVLMQRYLGVPKFYQTIIQRAVEHAASLNIKHGLRDWITSLEWDGTERIEHWLHDVFGTPKDAYTAAVARSWLVAMVARAFEPGCPFSQLLVLEGGSQPHKSLAIARLAAPWFDNYPGAASHNEAFRREMQGRWLMELRSVGSFNRSQTDQLMTLLSTRVDSYREGRVLLAKQSLRTTLFVSLTEGNTHRVGSHCWGVWCGDVDLEALALMRDQLFAEAYVAWRSGEAFDKVPKRPGPPRPPGPMQAPKPLDPWTDIVLNFAEHIRHQHMTGPIPQYVTTKRVLIEALEIPLTHHDHDDRIRVCAILRENGWVTKRKKFHYWKKVIRRPYHEKFNPLEGQPQ